MSVTRLIKNNCFVLGIVFVITVTAYRAYHHDKTKQIYQNRYPRTIHKSLFNRSPYHMILFKHDSMQHHANVRKNTLELSNKKQVTDPMDLHRRKYVIDNVPNTKKTIIENQEKRKIKNNLMVDTKATKKSFNLKAEIKPKSARIHLTPLQKSDPMDKNRKKYYVQKTGTRKDELLTGDYFYEPINNDLYPLVDDGNKRHSLTADIISTRQKQEQLKQSKLLQRPIGVNMKELAYKNANGYQTKPIEFYLSEKNGQVKIAQGNEAEKHFEANHLMLQPSYQTRHQQEEYKNRNKETQEYIHEILGTQIENDQKETVSSPGVSYPGDSTVPQQRPSFKTPIEFSAGAQYKTPTVLHEVDQDRITEESGGRVRETPEMKEKYFDNKPSGEVLYSDSPSPDSEEHIKQNEESGANRISDKIKNFNRIMNKLHRIPVDLRKVEEDDAESPLVHGNHLDHSHDWEQQFNLHTGEEQQNSEYFTPNNGQSYHETGLQRYEKYPIGSEPRQQENDPTIGYKTAFQLTKAIMNGARSMDNPDSSQSDLSVNGQTLIPEVFEAFSKTNNDLKQRYDALQQWALSRSTTASSRELRQQIRNLNELSNMVRLVNNLEKDMLKTILKKRRRYSDINDIFSGMGYKHEVIPGGKEDGSAHPVKNPADVHDLLQYIYDNYIENRTADEIPVVLQAFQRSLTDIVSMKQMNSTGNKTAFNDSNLLTQSLNLLTKSKEGGYNLDDDALSNFNFDEHYGKQGFFHEEGKIFSRDNTNKDEEGHKINKFVDRQQKSPVITVKLLKALDLFLDSIEIGRKIKRFRAKVEDIAKSMNGTVLLTSSMKQTLGDLNKEINETLVKSTSSSFYSKNVTKLGKLRTSGDKLNGSNHKQGVHRSNSQEAPSVKSPESYKSRLDTLRKQLNGDLAEDYIGKPYDMNGIYYENHKDDPNYLSYEKQWYENMTKAVDKSQEKQQPVHIFNPNMNVENFTASSNISYVYHHDPHSPYEHIPDLHQEDLYHVSPNGAPHEMNMTKLNNEAIKGQETLNKTISYDKILKTDLYNDTYHSWAPDNMTQLNLEAAKGAKYYHDVALNGTNKFDIDVQKIIDNAINEAKNGSEIDKFYYQGEKQLDDRFGEVRLNLKGENSPAIEMHPMFKALDSSHSSIDKTLTKHKIDEQTKNDTINYLEQEDRYINNMFYEENNNTNDLDNKIVKSNIKSENSDKKDFTPIKNNSTENKKFTHAGKVNGTLKTLKYDNKKSESATKLGNKEIVKKLEKEFFVTNTTTEIESELNRENKTLNNSGKEVAEKETKNIGEISAALDSSESSKKSDLKDDREKSDENDYLIKQVQKVAEEFIRDSSNDQVYQQLKDLDVTRKVVNDIDAATNFGELEKAINEIKTNKKTMEFVRKVANGPKVQTMQDGVTDKRNMKSKEDKLEKAHKLMEEINSISYVDDDDMKMLGEAIHRTLIPVKNNTKRTVIQKQRIAKSTKIVKHRRRKPIVNENERYKRSKFEKTRPMKIYRRRFQTNTLHGKWRHLHVNGTKKDLIEPKDANPLLKESFIKNLTASQQKLIWHILDRVYHNSSTSVDIPVSKINKGNELVEGDNHSSKESLNSLFNSFISEKQENANEKPTLKLENKTVMSRKRVSNITVEDADPIKSDKPGVYEKVTQDLTNPEAHPSNSTENVVNNENNKETFNLSTLNPATTNGSMNEGLSSYNNEDVSSNKNLPKSLDSSNFNTYEEENNDQFFFKNRVKKGKTRKHKHKAKALNEELDRKTDVTELPSILDHLDSVSKSMNNESAKLLKPFKQSNYSIQKSALNDDTKSSEKSHKEIPFQSTECYSVTTDGDDIFNVPSKCKQKHTTAGSDTSGGSEKKKQCVTHYISFKKNGYTYKIPAVKCEKDGKAFEEGKVKLEDIISGDATVAEEEENSAKGEPGFTQCMSQLNTITEGKNDLRIAGCVTKNNETSSIDRKNKTVEVLKVAKADRNEKVIYKGKNLVMTQNELGAEKIIINGSNKVIEIGYPADNDKNGFITLKQGGRLYKLPYKNHSEFENDELPAKSNVNWTPDYLRTSMTNTETFKVRDTEITKETYQSGAKVIRMEKEAASLSIYYPPKNKTKRYKDKGYMVLKENGQTYNIPLEGNKTLKMIGNQAYLGSSAFKNEDREASTYLPADTLLSRIQTLVPNVSGSTDRTVQSSGIIHIKERRFRNDNFQYKPKAYSADKFRHQKHWIEENPDERPNRRPNSFINEEEEHGPFEEEEVNRKSEDAKQQTIDEIPPIKDGRIRDEPGHIEVFPTIAYRGVDLKEFEANSKDDNDEPSIEDKESSQNRYDSSRDDERKEPQLNEDDDGGPAEETEPISPAQEDEGVEPPTPPNAFFTDDDNEDPRESETSSDVKPFAFLDDNDNMEGRSPNIEGSRSRNALRQPFVDEKNARTDNDNDNDDDDFFPLKEDFAPMNNKKMRRVPSLIIPPQLISGGVGLQNLQPLTYTQLPPGNQGNAFATGLRFGKEENVQVTPISGSMNPDINDRNRLEDFNNYAMGRDLKSIRGRKHKYRNKKLKEFVRKIMSSKTLMHPSINSQQLQMLREVQRPSLKRINTVLNQLQKEAFKNYMHPSNDKLDKYDRNTLKHFGYSDSEFYKLNKQITGKKRTPIENVGIEINGHKVGNTNLLLKRIPHV